jgi:hypothetical protein
MLAIAVTGCTEPRQSGAQTAHAPAKNGGSAAKKEAARNPVPLSPGCPVGATAALGLNFVEKGCNAIRPRPPGPVGVPSLTP